MYTDTDVYQSLHIKKLISISMIKNKSPEILFHIHIAPDTKKLR